MFWLNIKFLIFGRIDVKLPIHPTVLLKIVLSNHATFQASTQGLFTVYKRYTMHQLVVCLSSLYTICVMHLWVLCSKKCEKYLSEMISHNLLPCGYKMPAVLMKVNLASDFSSLSSSTRGLNLALNKFTASSADSTHGFPAEPSLFTRSGVHPIWVRPNKAIFLPPKLYKVCHKSKYTETPINLSQIINHLLRRWH